jgi:lipopolysaccharide export system protein LptA
LKSALVFSALFLLSGSLLGQNDVLELLPGSEELEYDRETGIHTLRGNVNFKYQGNVMFCDSALYFENRKIVRAYGHVHINKRDTLNLFCDSLLYNGRTRKAKLWGNVRVRDNEFKLTTDTLDYDAKKSQASYRYGGRVESIKSRETLTSKVGYFHPESKNFFFSNDVVYKGKEVEMTTDTLRYLYSQKKTFFHGPTNIEINGSSMYCEYGWYNTETEEGSLQKNASVTRDSSYMSGDTLLYLPKMGEYIGKGNVYFIDSTQDMSFTGNYAYSSDSLNYSLLTGDAIATRQMEEDTMHIHADTLFSFKNDSLEYLKAYHGARIYSNQFQARSDSMTYNKEKERIEMFVEPIVWSNDAELKGTFIDVHVNDSVIDKVNIYDGATILMEVEPTLYYNQIAGKDIIAYFKDNDLKKALVKGNAMTVSFPEDEEETDTTVTKKRMGMNRLYSSDLRIDIDSNEIVGITYLEQPDGAFYPMDQIVKQEQFVPGFMWKGALRPKNKLDLLNDEE